MKLFKFLFLFAVSAFIFSCKAKPDNKVYGTHVEFSHYEPQGAGNPVKQVFDTTVALKPTWSEAKRFAYQGQHWSWTLFQVILILLAVALIYGNVTDSKYLPESLSGVGWIVIVLFAFLGSLWPLANTHEDTLYVPKSQYEKEMNERGSTQAIWDSLESAQVIEWGKYDKYKKK
jgi:amino acid transporter